MKKIKKVKVKNFKILKSIHLELSNLNLVTGVNSSGKSSFIQALLLLKQNEEILKLLSLHSAIKNSKNFDIHNSFTLTEKFNLSINGEYISIGDKRKIFHQDSYLENIEISLLSDDGTFDFKLDKDITADISNKIEQKFRLINLFAEDFQYVSTNRVTPSTSYELSDISVNKNLIGNSGEFVAHYLDMNRHTRLNIQELCHQKSKTNQLLENVSLWLSEISDGVEIIVKKYEDVQKAALFYKYTYGDNTTDDYLPINVGFGLTYVLPIIVAILKSKKDDLLIIENPETHLHPAAQSSVARLCSLAAANGVQLIIETHSDHFLNGIRIATREHVLKPQDTKIYYFNKDSNLSSKVYEMTIDENGRINEDWPNGFFDEYQKSLDKLIW